ncbi:MAG: hypothetical protein KIT80_08925 [Chitinophagaceae bacterium]|nr:hypothetical protein [Chitinophagaceae bacterium]MCW5927019.1 hypothetical protein [Chitinophagaceae bacterium]
MEPNNGKLNKEEKENVLMVLNEFSQEYKANAKVISMLAANVKECIAKVNEYIEESKKEHTEIPRIQQVENLEERIEELKNLIHARPAEVKQEKRILLFPEHGAKEYYGTVLRWILYIIIATYGFFLLKYLIELLRTQH